MAIPIDPKPGDAVFISTPDGRWGIFRIYGEGLAGFGDAVWRTSGSTPAIAREALTLATVNLLGRQHDTPAEAFNALLAADPEIIERNDAAALARIPENLR